MEGKCTSASSLMEDKNMIDSQDIQHPWVGLSLMPHPLFKKVLDILLDAQEIDALSWSFDMGWSSGGVPKWVLSLLHHFSTINRLYGHGVMLSPLSSQWTDRQEHYIHNLTEEVKIRSFRHITEHFGFMTAGSALNGAPLPVTYCEAGIRVGLSRLVRMCIAAGESTPVGLENLALAFSKEEAMLQGKFIKEMIEPLGDNGIMLLDLHNLYCCVENFGLDIEEAMCSFPLEKVRELHLSGGSYSTPTSTGKPWRRDTHNGPIPEVLFSKYLPLALKLCPKIEMVTLERLGYTLYTLKDVEEFVKEYRRMRDIVVTFRNKKEENNAINTRGKEKEKEIIKEKEKRKEKTSIDYSKMEGSSFDTMVVDKKLANFQAALMDILGTHKTIDVVGMRERLLKSDDCIAFKDYIHNMEDGPMEVASLLVKKWCHLYNEDL